MPTNNVKLDVKAAGKREDLDTRLTRGVEAELHRETGLKPADVSFAEIVYTVTLTGLEGGKPSEKRYTGSSPAGIDAAIEAAMKDGVVDFDPANIAASLQETAQAPYFTVPVVSRSLERGKLSRYQDAAIAQLASTYARRLNRSPDGVAYGVVHSKDHFGSDGNVPKGAFSRITAQSRSNKSMDDALASIPGGRTPRKTRSTVYEQTASMMVYGAPESSLTIDAEGRASPLVITGVPTQPRASRESGERAYARGASPAAAEPAPLSHPNALM